MKSFFTPKEVAKLIGISYRQIQYWDKTGFIKPSYRRRGKYRLYTFVDLMYLKVTKKLREENYSIQRLRKTVKELRTMVPKTNSPLKDLTLLFDPKRPRRILMFNGDVFTNAKESLISFSVEGLVRDIAAMFPDDDRSRDGSSRQPTAVAAG